MPERDPTLALWSAKAAQTATGGRLEGATDWSISGLSIDSRSLAPGDLFVALKDARDGHDFVASAFQAGASAALVSRRPDGVAEDAPLLIVEDPLTALGALGAARRAESGAQVLAVTGSVGKTSTVDMARLCLSASGPTHAPVKSFNNHIGVPLTLARMPAESRFAVFEIGMNHAGEITPLSRLVRPHVAMVTTVAAVHLEFFESVEGIAHAKSEIFEGLEQGGTAVLNRDNAYFDLLHRKAEACGAGRILAFTAQDRGDGEAGARITDLQARPDGSEVKALIDGEAVAYRLRVPGRHHALNALAVLAAVKAMGADLEAAARALEGFQAGSGRGARETVALDGGDLTLIDESYNASPVSMAAALVNLGVSPTGPGGRRIAVLGDMLELGGDGPTFHADLEEAIAEAGIDLVFCSGPLMAHLWQALPESRKGAYGETSEALKGPFLSQVGPGDVVMVKGSLGSRMGPLVDALRQMRGERHGRPESGKLSGYGSPSGGVGGRDEGG